MKLWSKVKEEGDAQKRILGQVQTVEYMGTVSVIIVINHKLKFEEESQTLLSASQFRPRSHNPF